MRKCSIITSLVVMTLFSAGCGDDEKTTQQPTADAGFDAAGGADVAVESSDDAQPDAPPDALPWDPRFDDLAETIEKERLQLGAPGAAFAYIEDGEVAFAAGFGTKHPHGGEPVLPTTLFRIGSVTKVLTATAVLQQVEQGALDLDAPVTDVLPSYSFARDETWAPSILLRHTLDHTAGQFDYGEFGASDDADLEARMYAYAEEYYLMSPAGRFWNYSNPNYSLAGLMLEAVTGHRYREVMHDNVFEPLGMNRTLFLGQEVIDDGDYASGLTTSWETGEGEAIASPDAYDSAFMRPAGFAYSSLQDMARFVLFMMKGNPSVLSDSSRNMLHSPQVNTEMFGDVESYGFGLFVFEGILLPDGFRRVRVIAHGGDLAGFGADIYYLPDFGAGVVAFASTDDAHFSESILKAFSLVPNLPAPEPTPPPWSFDPSVLPDYVGSYHDPYLVGDFVVSESGGALTVSMPELDALGFSYDATPEPFAPDSFILEVDGIVAPLTFIRDEAGKVEYARTRYFVARAAAQPTALRGVASPAVLDAVLSKEAREVSRIRPWLAPQLVHLRDKR